MSFKHQPALFFLKIFCCVLKHSLNLSKQINNDYKDIFLTLVLVHNNHGLFHGGAACLSSLSSCQLKIRASTKKKFFGDTKGDMIKWKKKWKGESLLPPKVLKGSTALSRPTWIITFAPFDANIRFADTLAWCIAIAIILAYYFLYTPWHFSLRLHAIFLRTIKKAATIFLLLISFPFQLNCKTPT